MYDTDDYSEENKKKFSILFFIEINKKIQLSNASQITV